MNTIDRILGRNHSNQSVDDEFNRRNLSLDGFDDTIVSDDGKWHTVHGHYSTRSDNPQTSSKKLLIIENEILTKEDKT